MRAILRSQLGGAAAAISAGSAPSSCPPNSPPSPPKCRSARSANPIPVPGGYSILVMVDKRQILRRRSARRGAQPDADVARQSPPGTTEAQAQAAGSGSPRPPSRWAAAAARTRSPTALGAEVVANDQVRVRDLPPVLQQMLLNLSVGQATPAFGSLERVSVLVLCGRDDPEAAREPTAERDRGVARSRSRPQRRARSATCATCAATR